jgi:hypothetical protein
MKPKTFLMYMQSDRQVHRLELGARLTRPCFVTNSEFHCSLALAALLLLLYPFDWAAGAAGVEITTRLLIWPRRSAVSSPPRQPYAGRSTGTPHAKAAEDDYLFLDSSMGVKFWFPNCVGKGALAGKIPETL